MSYKFLLLITFITILAFNRNVSSEISDDGIIEDETYLTSQNFSEIHYKELVEEILEVKPDKLIKILLNFTFLITFIFFYENDAILIPALIYPFLLHLAYYDQKRLISKIESLKNYVMPTLLKSKKNSFKKQKITMLFINKDFAQILAHTNTFKNSYCDFLYYIAHIIGSTHFSSIFREYKTFSSNERERLMIILENFILYSIYSKIILGRTSANADLYEIRNFLKQP